MFNLNSSFGIKSTVVISIFSVFVTLLLHFLFECQLIRSIHSFRSVFPDILARRPVGLFSEAYRELLNGIECDIELD